MHRCCRRPLDDWEAVKWLPPTLLLEVLYDQPLWEAYEMPIYIAFALCFAAAQGEHCVMRSWWKPIPYGHHLHDTCIRAAEEADISRTRPWRGAENLICSYAPLPYPPTVGSILADRYG